MLIEVNGLHKSYLDGEGQTLRILQGLDFRLSSSSTCAIVGASGTGKSTFLHLLGALDEVDSGSIRLGGQELTRLNREARARFRNDSLGFIFQFHQLLQDFTALENVMMPRLIQGRATAQAERQAQDLLDEVGLGKRLHHKPSQLSGGEQQRVAIARALSNAPQLILADEPTGNLDRQTGEQIAELLLRLNRERGTTLVTITHNSELANMMDCRFQMESGRLHPLPN